MAGRADPAANVAAVLAALLTARGVRAGDLARQAGCTASHLSHILHRHCRPSPGLAARLDTALDSGGQIDAALACTPAARLRRPGPRPFRSYG